MVEAEGGGGCEGAINDAASREPAPPAAAAPLAPAVPATTIDDDAGGCFPPSVLRPSFSDRDPFRLRGRRAAAAVAAVAEAEACCFWANREARDVEVLEGAVEEAVPVEGAVDKEEGAAVVRCRFWCCCCLLCVGGR